MNTGLMMDIDKQMPKENLAQYYGQFDLGNPPDWVNFCIIKDILSEKFGPWLPKGWRFSIYSDSIRLDPDTRMLARNIIHVDSQRRYYPANGINPKFYKYIPITKKTKRLVWDSDIKDGPYDGFFL